jgi:acetylglutamate kinase
MVQELINKASVLVEEALPYIQKFHNKIFVVKYGGKAMINEELKRSVTKDIALLKTFGVRPIIVHGGGPAITREMEKSRIKPRFVDGLRVTDDATLRIVRRVFRQINGEIRDHLNSYGIKTRDATGCIRARRRTPDLGLVGDVTGVAVSELRTMLRNDVTPVISPVGRKGDVYYNINADTAATELAARLKAEKLTILTDVDGVIEKGKFVPHLSISQARKHIRSGVITSGMIPKVEACIRAVTAGCRKAHLINGTTRHALLFEIFTEKGIGTELVKE